MKSKAAVVIPLLWPHGEKLPSRRQQRHIRTATSATHQSLPAFAASLTSVALHITSLLTQYTSSLHPDMAESACVKATLHVSGLAGPVTEHILYEAFIPFGPIVDVTVPPPELPSSTDPHRGFGYVEFESADDASEAIDNMDLSELFGRVINVKVAKEKKPESEGLGSKTAVWEQVGTSVFIIVVGTDSFLRKDIWQSMPQRMRHRRK